MRTRRAHHGLVALFVTIAHAGCAADFAWLPRSARDAAPQPIEPSLESAQAPAPEGLSATSVELRGVRLQWEPTLIGHVGGYWIERAAERDGPYEPLARVEGRLATTYLDREAVPRNPPVSATADAGAPLGSGAPPADGVTWFYRVRSYSQDGRFRSPASEPAVATTALPPPPVEDLRAYSRQPRVVPLSWRAPDDPNVVAYRVERSPTARGPFELLAQLDGRHETTYIDRGLGDLRVFYYRVTALNAADGIGTPTEPVRAVTKPEPLPPIGLHRSAQRLGANELAWEQNVEEDIVGYRVFRIRDGDETPAQIASVGPDEALATDVSVAAGERVSYTLTAVDRDGLESDFADAIEVESEHYALSATARSDGVHLEWSDRSREGFRGAHVFRTALLQNKNLGFSTDERFVDRDVRAGATYRYTVVFERADHSLAPRSEAVEIAIPKRAAD